MSAKKQTKNNRTSKSTPKSQSRAQKGSSRAKKNDYPQYGLSPRVKAILYVALAIIFGILIFVKGESLYTYVRSFFFGVFGFSIFLLPFIFLYLSLATEKKKEVPRLKIKVFLWTLIVFFVGALIYILWGAQFNDCNFFECLIKLYLQSADTTHYMTFGSGIVGGILGYPLVAMCGKLVAFMISLVVHSHYL